LFYYEDDVPFIEDIKHLHVCERKLATFIWKHQLSSIDIPADWNECFWWWNRWIVNFGCTGEAIHGVLMLFGADFASITH
jgi:hypothetical protein